MTGSVPQVLKFANDFLPAVPTSVVSYRANLASYPLTTKHDNSIPGSELLQPADFASAIRARLARLPRLMATQRSRARPRTTS
jgi:hypothetical protein